MIDLDKAAEAEVFGALAVRSGSKHRCKDDFSDAPFTKAQMRVISEQALELLEFASQAGARGSGIIVGDVSLRLRERAGSRILSITEATPSKRKPKAAGLK